MSSTPPPLIPIYTSKGDAEAFLRYPYLFNRGGDWIGFVTPYREVYSVLGNFVGTLTNDPRIVGKRLGPAMKAVLAAAKAGQWTRLPDGAADVAGQRIEASEYEVRFQPREGIAAAPFDGNAGVVVLDTKVTPELEREGLARDFIRLVQVARKDAGFNVSDRIAIEVRTGPLAAAAIDAHLDTVKSETLAVSLGTTSAPAGTVSETKLGDEPIVIGVRVAG